MARYHLNPETGNPGLCRATKACPFGDFEHAHYATKEAAREAFELSMKPDSWRDRTFSTDEKIEASAQAIREVIVDKEFVKANKLLKPEYLSAERPFAGHCYVASEALYHTLGGKASGWTPCTIRHEGSPHWFLRGPNGEVIDLTSEQFATPVPYEQGRGSGFLTREPSKRARIVLEKMTALDKDL